MRTLKRWFAFVILSFVLPVAAAFAAPPKSAADALPAPAAYVDDYAGVLTASGTTDLERLCREVHDKTRAQIFFVTVKTTGDDGMDQFANDLFHRWKIGEKKTDRGVLVLLAIADRKRRIEVGYGLEPVIGDAQAGEIGRAMVPSLQAGDYDQAGMIGVQGVARLIAADSHVTLDALTAPRSQPAKPKAPVSVPLAQQHLVLAFVILLVCFGLVFVVVLVVLFSRLNGRRIGTNSDPASSGVAYGGASDSSSSSGSDSSSFSGGDGGDSGGGGASGDW